MKRSRTSKPWWLDRHVHDPYVKRAQQEGYRSRAAYKLLGLHEKDHLLRPGMTVVDLGAAPGGWCQVAAKKVGVRGRVIGIDLLDMAPVQGVEFIQGDFADARVWGMVESSLQGQRIDLVLSDMAPNLSGVMDVDQARHYVLAELALEFVTKCLQPDGAFVVKAFQGLGFENYLRQVKSHFRVVTVRKPDASRNESRENFLVARGLAKSPVQA